MWALLGASLASIGAVNKTYGNRAIQTPPADHHTARTLLRAEAAYRGATAAYGGRRRARRRKRAAVDAVFAAARREQ